MKKQEDFIFGLRAVIEAIHAGREIDRILMVKKPDSEVMRELFPLIRANDIAFQYVPFEKLNRITRKNHQGVIAFLSAIAYSPLEEIVAHAFEQGKDPQLIMLDQVSDVRNFGAISRSAECLGFTAVIIPQRGSARINADAVKTSAGALMNLPVCRVKSLDRAVEYLRNSGLKIVAISEKAEKLSFETELKGPILLIMGGEEKGISSSLYKSADLSVRIPMNGKTASLNVSVAASISMYEVKRQSEL